MSSAAFGAPVAIIGGGRLGRVLAGALAHAGGTVRGPFGRGEEIPEVEIALLCVPDALISEAACVARDRAGLIGHVSGATTLADVDFSLHPMQTFTGTEPPEIFHGIGCAVAGATDEARATAARLAEVLGAVPIRVDDEHRTAYHAAASLASNLVLPVLDAAEQIAGAAGTGPEQARILLAPLVRQSVDNWAAAGAVDSLTGPIVRGDEVTVERQRAAIAEGAPELLPLFDLLCEQTRVLSRDAEGGAG